MKTSITAHMAAVWLLTAVISAEAQVQAIPARAASEEIEPRIIGTTGTTMVGLAGYVDRFFSSERGLPTNYTAQIDISRFVARALVVRGGIAGSGSFGGEDSEDLPTGTGAPAVHALAGLLYYFTPQSMLSLFAGAEYALQLTQRDDADRGAILGIVGAQGAVSSRASVFVEGGYGVGLVHGAEDGVLSRFIGRLGIRLKF